MKKHFVTGLVFLLPLAATIAIVTFIVNFLTQPFVGVTSNFLINHGVHNVGIWFLSDEQIIHYGSQVLILVMLFLFTLILGALTRWFFINSLINFGDYILHRIPVINKIYKTLQDIIQTIFGSQIESFEQVVMVPFPARNVFCIGLVTRESPPLCNEAVSADLVSVFVPTTPNPTSGYLLMFQREDVQQIDMKVEDAIKFIISCGVIFPDEASLQSAITHASTKNNKDKEEKKSP